MAYDFFPKSVNELQKKTSSHPPAVQGELFLLFDYLKKKFPNVETPINLDMTKRSSVNVSRSIQEDISLVKIKNDVKIKSLNMKFGNGSSGNRGVNNRGNLFEPQFAEAIIKWWSGETVSDRNMLAAIEDLDKTYNISKSWKTMKVDVVGGQNTKRPIVYTPKILISNPKNTGTNVGSSVTDITLTNDKNKKIYLSLKLGTTVTFFNVGVRTVLPPEDIQAYNLRNGDGKNLLKLFGIDERLFCDAFNDRLPAGGIRKSINFSGTDIIDFMKSGIGQGYHIIHKMSGTIKSKKMDAAALTRASRVTTATIYYGGKTGSGKRVDMEMESETYNFKLNIRDTQGRDGFPTRLMCDFSYK